MNIQKIISQVGLIEVTLGQLILYGLVWLTNDYLGFLLTCVIVPLVIGVGVVSLISDSIEASGVGKSYYLLLLSLALSPIAVMLGFMATGVDPSIWFAKGS